ncbi:ATP-binding protein [Burkholderia sp. Ax-1719]|uniref:ATP-binding protein n=1 Tax=Burkholderia sp. Ax-1719 TaxID=2608334 RepID=UPI00141DCC55|nr:ATP-binding protein [Burkholderia sp. Ax-1719]NIE63061.1 ATP-binding protein [Burkholderia sp. Ax-1719]
MKNSIATEESDEMLEYGGSVEEFAETEVAEEFDDDEHGEVASEEELEQIKRFQQHPINNPACGVRIWTKPIDELYAAINNAVIRRRSGIWVPAASGDGKTSAIIASTKRLRRKFGKNIALVRVNYMNHQAPTVRGFHVQLLKALGIKELRGETPALRIRVINGFVDRAVMANDNAVYLFVDEAQQMRLLEMRFLKDLANELEEEQVQLVTFFFGQNPGLSDAVAALKRAGGFDLVSRFVNREIPLRSFSTVEDIAHLLDGIDKQTDKDGVPFTAFFLPKAFEGGYRLKSEAKRFFKAMQDMVSDSARLGYPARQVFFAIQDFFSFQTGEDAPNFKGTTKAWKEALQEANMRIALEHKRDTPSAQTGAPDIL